MCLDSPQGTKGALTGGVCGRHCKYELNQCLNFSDKQALTFRKWAEMKQHFPEGGLLILLKIIGAECC